MPPTGYRTMQRSALRSRKLRGLDHASERLYWRLLLAVDPYGTTHADEALVQAEAVPGVTAYVFHDGSGDEIGMCLDALERVGLIVRWEADSERWLHLVNFEEHQLREFMRKRGKQYTPDPPAELLERARSLPLGRTNAGEGLPPEPKPEPEPEPEPSIALTGSSAGADAGHEPEDVRDGGNDLTDAGHTPSPALQVFEHWRSVECRTDGIGSNGAAPKFTADRKRKVEARLKEGYTVEQLCQAIDGYAADPWHLGTNPQRKRYTDLTTTMKGGAKVDEGMRLATAALVGSNGKGRFAEYD